LAIHRHRRSEEDKPSEQVGQSLQRQAQRRRFRVIRTATVAATMAIAMIFFLLWYRGFPHRLDCYRSMHKLVVQLDQHRQKYGRFPPVIPNPEEVLGRYKGLHYKYRFEGYGAPGRLPEGTIIAYCRRPHHTLFHKPWRHVALWQNGKIAIVWLPEDEFQKTKPRAPFVGWR